MVQSTEAAGGPWNILKIISTISGSRKLTLSLLASKHYSLETQFPEGEQALSEGSRRIFGAESSILLSP